MFNFSRNSCGGIRDTNRLTALAMPDRVSTGQGLCYFLHLADRAVQFRHTDQGSVNISTPTIHELTQMTIRI
jgi:hypothetical protein